MNSSANRLFQLCVLSCPTSKKKMTKLGIFPLIFHLPFSAEHMKRNLKLVSIFSVKLVTRNRMGQYIKKKKKIPKNTKNPQHHLLISMSTQITFLKVRNLRKAIGAA